MKNLLTLAFVALAAALQAADPDGAIACLQSLPAKYKNGVLKLSADNASPTPDAWYLVVQSGGDDSNIHNLSMAGGQILSNKRTLGFREIFSQASPMALDRVVVDSRDAFGIAQRYARANRMTVGSVSFALQQSGDSAVPVWSLWCYGPSGSYLGFMNILATDGTVVSNDAFPRKP
jgi:hypothetical protein